MKRKWILLIIAGVTVVLSLLILTGCCNLPHDTNQAQNTTPEHHQQATVQTQDIISENYQQSTSDERLTQKDDTRQISSQKARKIAVDFVGYGIVNDIQAFTEEGILIFEVDIRHDDVRYVVLLNAESGDITSLNRHTDDDAAVASPDDSIASNENAPQTSNETTRSTAQQTTSAATTTPAATTPVATPATTPAATPQPAANPSTSGQRNRPSNPAISLNRAIEIATADLASRGINATYRSNSGMDWERGQWVWELLFSTSGERMPLIEYYINVDNGSIVKFEWDD